MDLLFLKRFGLITSVLLLAPMLAYSQTVDSSGVDPQRSLERQLDLAAAEFDERVARTYRQVAAAIDLRLEEARLSGDLDAAIFLQKSKRKFQATAEPPDGAMLKATVERGRRDISRAASKLKAENIKVINEHLKAGDIEAARVVLEEQTETLAGIVAWLKRRSRGPQRSRRDVHETTAQSESVLALRSALAGSVWIHHYKGGNFEFAFGRDGVIHLHTNWAGTRWTVTGPREVTFTGTTGATMKFFFNQEVDSFRNIDWDGETPTTGTKTDRTLP